MLHYKMSDKDQSIKWAELILENGNFVVFDTETTGLYGEIIEVGVVGPDGEVLMDTRLRPKVLIETGATAVHGIRDEDLVDERPFSEVYEELKNILTQPDYVLVYNAAFDSERLGFTCEMHCCNDRFVWKDVKWECVMVKYSRYVGEKRKRGGYKWQRLPGGDHSAVGDALATLKLVKEMARHGK